MSTLSYGSLFAGIGGFDAGFDSAGWRCSFQIDSDTTARSILERHWPTVPRFEDVRDASGYDLDPVDVLAAGFPCQDLSVAGAKKGLDGERSGLFFEFVRIVEEMRDATRGASPRWIVWENVAGLLRFPGALEQIYRSFADSGALVAEHRTLDARCFGVPQRRRRLYGIAGYDPRAERLDGVLLVDEDSEGSAPASPSAPLDARQSLASAPADAGERRVLTELLPEFAPTLLARYAKGPSSSLDDGIVPTAAGFRRFTPRECERLQGFDDHWTRWRADGTEIPKGTRYRLCGNAVVPQAARWLALRIERAERTLAALPGDEEPAAGSVS